MSQLTDKCAGMLFIKQQKPLCKQQPSLNCLLSHVANYLSFSLSDHSYPEVGFSVSIMPFFSHLIVCRWKLVLEEVISLVLGRLLT